MFGFLSALYAKILVFLASIATAFALLLSPSSAPVEPVLGNPIHEASSTEISGSGTSSEAAGPATQSAAATSPATETSTLPSAASSSDDVLAKAPSSTTVPISATTSADIVPYPAGVSDTNIKAAVVNIICISKSDAVPSMSASGVMIDPRGVIATNAHVGQYFLLTDYMEKDLLRCVIRGGNPARTLYEAELLYLPEQWIKDNPGSLGGGAQKGTGEDDFAFLRITERVDGGAVGSLPFLPYSTAAKARKGDTVVLAAYPAEFIPTEDISSALYDLSFPTKIENVFTFSTNKIDIISMHGSYLAQRGSSGGAMVDSTGNLAGIIATESSKSSTDGRNLYAITIGYIDRELDSFTGGGLDDLLSGNISRKAINFSLHDSPSLRKIVEKGLPEN